MELVVVLFILSLAAAVILPRLPSTAPGELRGSARGLAATLRYVSDLAIAEKTPYRIRVGVGTATLAVKKLLADGSEADSTDPFLQKRIIADGVVITDTVTQPGGKVVEGEAVTAFGPSGIDRYTVIHLKGSDGGFFTVTAFPASGKVTVDEGYREEGQ
jgi:general secretion pathway protein H